MIGATKFAGAYGSFWRDVTPTIDLFVRRINIELYERVEAPIDYQIDPNRSALVAETAFALFDKHFQDDEDSALIFERFVARAIGEARHRLELLNAVDIGDDLNLNESNVAQELFRRLRLFFDYRRPAQFVVRPVFPGCGFVDLSEGDVIYDDALFEIKMVDRTFRSVDIKQLLIYAALNHQSGRYHFQDLGLYNPRRGTEFRMGLDDVCMVVSGVSAIELLELVAYSVASGEISR